MIDGEGRSWSGGHAPEDEALGGLVKIAESRWMQAARDRLKWRSLGEAYSQQWMSTG